MHQCPPTKISARLILPSISPLVVPVNFPSHSSYRALRQHTHTSIIQGSSCGAVFLCPSEVLSLFSNISDLRDVKPAQVTLRSDDRISVVFLSDKPARQVDLVTMAVGDDALAGREENDVTQYFPATLEERTIFFKGHYLSIYHQQTGDYKTHIDNAIPSTESIPYTVPAGYSVYVRGGTVYFQV